MENEPHNEPWTVADGASDEPSEEAVEESYVEQAPRTPAEAGEPPPVAPGAEIGRRPMRSGAEAGAGAALAEAGSAAPGPPGEGSFGAWLRRQREIREIDLREIADKTKISLRYLKAMEQDRFEVLPAPIFARGFLREYAKYVGLDADEVVNYYLAAHHPAGDEEGEETLAGKRLPRAGGGGPLTRPALIGFVVLLLIAALAYWWFYQRSQDTSERPPPPIASPATALPASDRPPPQTAAPAPPVGGEPGGAAAASAMPLVVTFDFTEKCWLEVQVDGGRRLSRNYVAGESLQLEAERRVTLETVGNVGGVEVQVNGRPYELPTRGGGRTARGVVIDVESADAPRDS